MFGSVLYKCCLVAENSNLKNVSLIPKIDGLHLQAMETPPGLQKYVEKATLQDTVFGLCVCKILGLYLLPHNANKELVYPRYFLLLKKNKKGKKSVKLVILHSLTCHTPRCPAF